MAKIIVDNINEGNPYYKIAENTKISITITGSVSKSVMQILKNGTIHNELKISNVLVTIKNGDFIEKSTINFVDDGSKGVFDKMESWTTEFKNLKKTGTYYVTAEATYIGQLKGFGESTISKDKKFSIEVDNTGPKLELTPFPKARTSEGLKVEIKGKVKDTQSGLVKLSWSINGAADLSGDIGITVGPKSEMMIDHSLNLPKIGKYTLRLTAKDVLGNPTEVSQEIEGVDDLEPSIEILHPIENESIVVTQMPGKITVNGTASDNNSGMVGGQAVVELSLDGQLFEKVSPGAKDDWRTWSKEIELKNYGMQVIYFKIINAAGNPNKTPEVRRFELLPDYKPKDLEERLRPRAYLEDLLQFINGHINKTPQAAQPTYPTTKQLEDLLHQRFIKISQPLFEKGEQPVPLLRIVNEILYSESKNKPTIEGYIRPMYEALLNEMGTSSAELRMMRGAPADARQAVARRLLIGLTPQAAPDELARLTFVEDQLSEKNLETYFGIIPYEKDSLANYPTPTLLTWQQQFLKASWLAQDREMRSNKKLQVIIDPDLIDESDLVNTLQTPEKNIIMNGEVIVDIAQSAINLLIARRKELSDYYNKLKKVVPTIPKEPKFSALLKFVYDNIDPRYLVKNLETIQSTGDNVESFIKDINLSFPAFNRLLQLWKLSEKGDLIADEWDDLYHIFTQVHKMRKMEKWASEEMHISLNPKTFHISNKPKSFNPWRASPLAYRQWQELLEARIQQQSALIEGYYEKLRNAELRVLPGLRDAMLKKLAEEKLAEENFTEEQKLDKFTTQYTERYFIDFRSGASIITTRVEQACATLQNLVLSIRTKRLSNDHWTKNWEVEDDGEDYTEQIKNFDQEWAWMGTYETWRAAVSVFLFPENYLFPLTKNNATGNLLPNSSIWTGFIGFAEAIRKQIPMTSESAINIASEKYKGSLPVNFSFKGKRTDGELKDLKKYWADEVDKIEVINEISYYVPLAIALQLQRSGEYQAALDWYQSVYAYQLKVDYRKISPIISDETNTEPDLSRTKHWCRQLNAHDLAASRKSNSYTRFTLMSLIRCFIEFGDMEFTKETYESIANARSLYQTALGILESPDLKNISDPAKPKAEPPVPNPAIEALRGKANNQLRKIREGRNIAGMKREMAYSRNQGLVPGHYQPTPYHYKTLMERGKQLVAIAQQVEAAYLSAMAQHDGKAYQRFEANKGMELTMANLNVYRLRETEAQFGEKLANKQIEKSQYAKREMDSRISRGFNSAERQMLQGYQDVLYHKNVIAGLDASIGTANAIQQAGGFLEVINTLGKSLISGATIAGLHVAKGFATGDLNAAEADLQANSFYASHERRLEEWRFQSGAATIETETAVVQLQQAQAHTQVVQEERKVAELQARQARDTLEFLDQQQLNEEMYAWMSGVLAGVYAYFLQQASSIARLAQYQLAFERQETVPSYIQVDYWKLPNNTNTTTQLPGNPGRDRLGLTGAELLLQDINQLDQYAFESEKRKLNLSQTLSLAQLFPQEFQEFKKTGILRFATSLDLFDREFPGHYLRMIKRVKTSVIALVPPGRGIRASLYSNGISRIVGKGEPFLDLLLRREPEYVALTAPIGASGVFDLDMQSDLLQPFEGSGIETSWEFEMPKPSNPMNYQTIADVLITLDYTALYDDGYRQRVIKSLPRQMNGMRMFSVRGSFPDQWYDLVNAEQVDEEQRYLVQLSTVRGDFPSNLEIQGLETLVVMLVFKQEKSYQYPVGLTFNKTDADKILSNTAGILSTRNNASAWRYLLNFDNVLPVGDWVLDLKGNDLGQRQQLKDSLKAGDLEDIAVIFGYRGLLPDWPK